MALLHECSNECKAYKDTDAPYVLETIKGIEFRRCPIPSLDNNVFNWLLAYKFFNKGIFPRGTGWLDQSNKLIEVCNFIDSIIEEKNENNGKRIRDTVNAD